MTRPLESGLRLAALTTGIVAALAGCAGASDDSETDWSGDTATHDDELSRAPWRSRHRLVRDGGVPSTGGTGAGGSAATGGQTATGGGTATGGRLVDVSGGCEVCARAQACCNEATSGDALCTFSAATCAGLETAARNAYVNSCKTLIQTVASVRTSLPTSCR